MIRYEQAGSVPATINPIAATLPALLTKAASQLASATSAAEILEAKDAASVAYDAAKKAARFAKAKQAHDDVISAVYRAQADALEIESMAKRRLADEYDAAMERGDFGQKPGPKIVSTTETISAKEVVPPKLVHEARQVRDAETADPGIVRRVLDEKIEAGQEPTKAALREVVTEAAMRGLRGSPAPSNKNPLYRAPTKAGAAWTHLYGTCRGLVEWATDENELLALHGKAERTDDQSANLAAVRKAADFLNKFLENVDA